MKKALGLLALGIVSLAAQGQRSATTHSNAPAGTPAASTDRDKGTDRASDVGKGKHKGLAKTHKKQSKHS